MNDLSEDREIQDALPSCQTESPCPSCGTCGTLLIDVIDNDSPEVLATVTYNPGSGKVTEKLHMAPASVQPPTEDVVEIRKALGDLLTCSGPAGIVHISLVEFFNRMTTAYRLGRDSCAGWHSWESVEKAIHEVWMTWRDHNQVWTDAWFTLKVRARLEAEPAERVMEPAVEAVAMVICTKCGARVGYPELHNKWHNIYDELDAQGGNKK